MPTVHKNEEIVFVDSKGIERRAWVAAVNEGTTPPTIDVSHTPPGGGKPPHPDDLPFVAETYRVVSEENRVAGRAYYRTLDSERPMHAQASRRPPTDPPAGAPVAVISVEEAEMVVREAKEAAKHAKGGPDELGAAKRLEEAEAKLESAKAAAEAKEEEDKARDSTPRGKAASDARRPGSAHETTKRTQPHEDKTTHKKK